MQLRRLSSSAFGRIVPPDRERDDTPNVLPLVEEGRQNERSPPSHPSAVTDAPTDAPTTDAPMTAPTDAPTNEIDDLRKPPPMALWGRRPLVLVAAAGFALFALLGPKVPRDQRLRVPLGEARPRVREARISWTSTSGEPLREATFAFPRGDAPEALIHELRLPDGDYDVDVEIVLTEGRTASRKRVTVSGATTTLDSSVRP